MNKKTILLIDDNKDFADVIRNLLENGGYRVSWAADGETVFHLIGEQRPDLVILDIMMPKIDGLEVLRRLKKTNGTASIPVIMVTAKGQYSDVLTGYELGTDYYITKPFTSAQLLKGVSLVLGETAASPGSAEPSP
jgi:two-component system phosphate regulon response regulator PhoB